MAIHRCNSLVCTWLQKLAGDDLLHRQYHTILAPNADSCSAVLNRLDRVLDLREKVNQSFLGLTSQGLLFKQSSPYLKVPAVRREDRVG